MGRCSSYRDSIRLAIYIDRAERRVVDHIPYRKLVIRILFFYKIFCGVVAL